MNWNVMEENEIASPEIFIRDYIIRTASTDRNSLDVCFDDMQSVIEHKYHLDDLLDHDVFIKYPDVMFGITTGDVESSGKYVYSIIVEHSNHHVSRRVLGNIKEYLDESFNIITRIHEDVDIEDAIVRLEHAYELE